MQYSLKVRPALAELVIKHNNKTIYLFIHNLTPLRLTHKIQIWGLRSNGTKVYV
ncbi:hypothetical protein THF5G08_230042 [Vibrio jasicida]|nr:hypothetical protein THF5G08_230042 [Vibrio jasicida]